MGNFISSTAFLPSSTCMYLTCIWLGFWLRNKYNWAVYTVAFSAMFSWPFSVALGIPLAIDCIFKKKKASTFIYYAVESFVIINLIQGEIKNRYSYRKTLIERVLLLGVFKS